ncbi:carboxypeptidase regulatory-like domain-containing protein [Pedobacter sp. PAMC26386]|nr:carboxypeptidase regulatory-like domain-containing protein [Pedobacter sp. PAMC26386]
MIKLFILIVLYFCFIKSTFSQTSADQLVKTKSKNSSGIIQGSIKDHDTYSPIDGATVILKNLNDRAKSHTLISLQDGSFNFKQVTKGNYSLTISYAHMVQVVSNQFLIVLYVTISTDNLVIISL